MCIREANAYDTRGYKLHFCEFSTLSTSWI